MEAKRNPYRYDPAYYIQGSTAKKLNFSEEAAKRMSEPRSAAQPRRREQQRKKPSARYQPQRANDRRESIQRQAQKEQEKGLISLGRGVNFFGMVMLAGALLATVYFCIGYLQLRAESTRLDKSITALESELAMMVDANRAMTNSITSDVDLERIYQTAVGEMGMVFPNNNEVLVYDPADLGYVRQYARIPDEVTSILDKFTP